MAKAARPLRERCERLGVHSRFVVVGQADLLQVVAALNPRCGRTNLLHRRQEQANQDGDDRNHHQ
jgi:hypothetical protein